MKRCSKCGEEKPLDGFHGAGGETSRCKPCALAQQREYRARRARGEAAITHRNPHVRRYIEANPGRNLTKGEVDRLRKYGLGPDEMDALIARQGGGCAICRQTLPLSIDHDHACCAGARTCGRCVRGALCAPCNTGLGLFADDGDRLLSAALYRGRGGSGPCAS